MIKSKGLVIHPEELSEYWVKRFLSTDLDLLGLHPVGGITGGRTVDDMIEWQKNAENKRLLHRLTEKGIEIEHEMHVLSWLLPRDLFSKQPEWFRMDENGNRVNDFHFCHSNPDALAYISERSKKLAEIFVPTTGRYHFWIDDRRNAHCHCAKCAQTGYSDSDAAMLVYNAMLAGIKAFDAKAKQCYLAYHDTSPAPSKIKPSEGIFLEYAPMDRDPDRSMRDPSSEKNKKTAGDIDGLLQVFPREDAKALDYWLDSSWHSGHKKPIKKFPFHADVAAEDIAFYHEKGFEIITCFACFLGEEYFLLHHEEVDLSAYAQAFHKL